MNKDEATEDRTGSARAEGEGKETALEEEDPDSRIMALYGDRDGMTPVSGLYFKTLNNSVMDLNPAALRQSNADIINDSILRNRAAGVNESTFSVGADIMAVMRPKNGVKIRRDK